MSYVSKSLRSLTKNERPWAIRSGRSEEVSNRERIAQVAHQNERLSELLIFFSKSLIRSFLGKKIAIGLEIRWANSQPCVHIMLHGAAAYGEHTHSICTVCAYHVAYCGFIWLTIHIPCTTVCNCKSMHVLHIICILQLHMVNNTYTLYYSNCKSMHVVHIICILRLHMVNNTYTLYYSNCKSIHVMHIIWIMHIAAERVGKATKWKREREREREKERREKESEDELINFSPISLMVALSVGGCPPPPPHPPHVKSGHLEHQTGFNVVFLSNISINC